MLGGKWLPDWLSLFVCLFFLTELNIPSPSELSILKVFTVFQLRKKNQQKKHSKRYRSLQEPFLYIVLSCVQPHKFAISQLSNRQEHEGSKPSILFKAHISFCITMCFTKAHQNDMNDDNRHNENI